MSKVLDKDAARFWGEAALSLLRGSVVDWRTAAEAADVITGAYLERRGDPPFDPSSEFARLFPKVLESAEKHLQGVEAMHLRTGGVTADVLCTGKCEPTFKSTRAIEEATCLACLRIAALSGHRES